jgi:hypothetical protein
MSVYVILVNVHNIIARYSCTTVLVGQVPKANWTQWIHRSGSTFDSATLPISSKLLAAISDTQKDNEWEPQSRPNKRLKHAL